MRIKLSLMPTIINLIAGISLFAAVNHLVIGRSHLAAAKDHYLFSFHAFASFLTAATLVIEYRIFTQDAFVELIRYQQIIASLYYISLLIFVRQMTGIVEKNIFYLFLLGHALFCVAALVRPYGLFLDELHGVMLPEQGILGSHVVAVSPKYSIWSGLFILFAWAHFIYLEYCCISYFKKTRIKESAFLGVIVLIYYAGFALDIYSFAANNINTYFSFLSFPILILMMSSHIAGAKQAKRNEGTENKYKRLVEVVRDDYIVFSYFVSGHFGYVSPSVEKILGYKSSVFIDDSWREIKSLLEDVERFFSKVVPSEFPSSGRIDGLETNVLNSKGVRVCFDVAIQVLKNEAGELVSIEGFAKDISKERATENSLLALNNELEFRVEARTQALQEALEKLRGEIDCRDALEKQLRQAQKMESIGQLAGGVAHDFNNILTAISGFAELAVNANRQGLDISEDLERILEASERGAKLTEQLLGFARRQIATPKTIRPDEALASTLKMIPRLLESNIQIDVQFRGDAGYIRIDPVQFDQVMINLIVNARDAMPRGGEITVITQNLSAVDINREGRPIIVPEGEYVSIAVVDRGCGIAAEDAKKIFEPFYTTKPVGKGSGLGLSVCYGVVKQCNGYIFVDSEPEFGSVFEVILPLVRPTELERFSSKTVKAEGELLGGSETILLVEDDISVSMLTEKILTSMGYKILLATNGVEALDVIERHPEKIELLITDFMMPKMDGHELINTVRLLSPELAILCLSGYADGELIDDLRSSGVAFLQKPYSPIQLAKIVRQLLSKQQISQLVAPS